MKMNSVRIICNALILIFLMAVSGCATKMVAAKDADQPEVIASAMIQEIIISEDGSKATITTSKPLTYTSYRTSDPPKIYVDLAQTEPGSIKPLESTAGPIKGINVSRQDFGSGFLSRVEITLRSDAEFAVKADAADRGKLYIVLSPTTVAENSVKVDIPTASNTVTESAAAGDAKADVGATSEGKPAAEVKSKEWNDAAVDLDNDNSLKKDLLTTASDDKPVTSPQKTLSAVNIIGNTIALSVIGGPVTFTSFKLDKPGRLVVDLFETKTSIPTNLIAINRFGVSKARIGLSPEKVRIVFDSARNQLPSYQIEKSDHGLNISFSEAGADLATKPEGDVADPPKPVVQASKAANFEKGSVESIDFKVLDVHSRVEIKTNGICALEKPAETSKGILLNFKNCELPKNLQRTLDARSFASPVLSITPYQVKVAGDSNARILVKLRSKKAQFFDRKQDNTYILEVKHTDIPSASGLAKEKAAPSSPKIADELLAASSKESDSGELPKSVVTRQVPKKIYSGRKVTLEFSDADIRKIFQLIAEVSNLNFLIADDVTGTISIKLVNVPWDQALDVILDTKNLGMMREGNIVQIKPKSKMQSQADEELAAKKAQERGMELRTEIFDVNYAAVADIATQFGTLKSERGVISTDSRTNRVIVKDIATTIEDMKLLLKSLDTPEKQVMIEARIVEATTSFVRDLGVQWGIHYADGSASVAGISKLDTGFGGQVSPPPTSGTLGPGAAVGMSFGKLSSNLQLDMRLSAAVTASQIKLISSPRVVTLNNKPAKISSGQAIPYQTTSAEGTKTEFVEAALTLEVTPHVTADGSIGMKIKAANNSPGVGSPPPISKKEATTELLLKNGETTVIGGIYTDNDTSADQGVPFLQDIPLLGWLFKSNSTRKEKNELLIFITPKIVS